MKTPVGSVNFLEGIPYDTPFEIVSFKDLYARYSPDNDILFKCHRLKFNALLIVLSGEGTHSIDCKEYHLKAGVILPIVKEQVHCFERNLKVDGIVITFTEEFISENTSERDLFHFLQVYYSNQLKVSRDELQLIKPYTDLLFQEEKKTDLFLKKDILKALFLSLLIQLKKLTITDDREVNTTKVRTFMRFKKLIAQEYSQTHNAKDYAVQLGISYKYLNELCKEFSGKTAKEFIDNWLILEIKRNIAERKYNIKEIAYQMGYEEPTNFIRFFKKHTGKTPKEFSQQI